MPKNYYNQTLIDQVILENAVTCFFLRQFIYTMCDCK